MEEEEQKKSASKEAGAPAAVSSALERRQREVGTDDQLDEDYFGSEFETDSMSELLKLLEDDSAEAISTTSVSSSPTSYGMRVRFSDNPYSSALVFQSSSSYITINGNEESCGSSFSESESSVMASVDTGGGLLSRNNVGSSLERIRRWLELEEEEGDYYHAWGKSEKEARGLMMDCEWGEEHLAWFLGEEKNYLF